MLGRLLQVGEHYLAEGWGQQLMTLADFISSHIQQQSQEQAEQPRQGKSGAPASAAAGPEAGATVGGHKTANEAGPSGVGSGQGGSSGKGYLAQHPLFDQIPALAADVAVPEVRPWAA